MPVVPKPGVTLLTDGREVLIFPFPLSTGQFATLELPNEPLSRLDAERFSTFLRSLSRECPECGGERPGCVCDVEDDLW